MADYEEYFGLYGFGDYATIIEKQIRDEARQYEYYMDEKFKALEEDQYYEKSSSPKKFATHKAFNNDVKKISDEEFLAFRNCFLNFFCRNNQTFLSSEEIHQMTQALKTLRNLYSKIKSTTSLNSRIIKSNFPNEYEKLIHDKDALHKRILAKIIKNAIFVNDMTSTRIDSYLNKIADNKIKKEILGE